MTIHASSRQPYPAPVPLRLDAADAVIFDFNGTLSDDEGLLLELLDDISQRRLGRGVSPDDYARRFVGRSDRDILGILAAESAATAIAPVSIDQLLDELVDLYVVAVQREPRISANAQALVRALVESGRPLAVVTGARRAAVMPALESAGLARFFSVLVTEEDVTRGKPDPEGLLRAAALLGAPLPARTVVFEDSIPGLMAATAAGMRGVAVRGSAPDEELAAHAQLVVSHLRPDLTRACVPGA